MNFDELEAQEKALALRMISFTDQDTLNVNMSDPSNDYLLVINTLDIPDDACSGFQPSLTFVVGFLMTYASWFTGTAHKSL